MRLMRVVLLGAAGMAFASGTDAQTVSPTVQPSIELPGELARVLTDYESRWSGGDADGLAELFVEEGLIVRDGTWIRGRPAIREAYQGVGGALRLRAVEYATDGDVGFIVGAFGYGTAQPVQDLGLFVLTLRRDRSGQWLIVSDMDRSGG